MTIKNILKSLFVLPLMVVLTGCSEELTYTPAEIIQGAQVYFSSSLPSSINVSKSESSFDVVLNRVNTDEAITVKVNVLQKEGSAYTVASDEAVFEAGSSTAAITLTYDPDALEYDVKEKMVFTIADSIYTTPYGVSAYTALVGPDSPYESLGTGMFKDVWSQGKDEYVEVEIEQNLINTNRFRIVKPYDAIAEKYYSESETSSSKADYLYFEVLQPGDVCCGNDVTMSDLVYFEECSTRYFYGDGYGDIDIVHPAEFGTYFAESAWARNCVLKYQDNGLPGIIQLAPYYYLTQYDGGWNEIDTPNNIKILFPGVEEKDYSASIAYTGKFTNSENYPFVCASVELAADVATAKVGIAEGKDAVDEAYANLVVDVTASGEVKIPMDVDAASGKYTLIVVTYDADGIEQDYNTTTFLYSTEGSKPETWTKIATGDFKYLHVYCNADGTPSTDKDLDLLVSSLDSHRHKISKVFDGVDFIFEVNDDNTITFENQSTGYSEDGNDLMVCDIHAIWPDDYPTSSYVKDGVYHFNTAYYLGDEWWGYDKSARNTHLETFTITSTTSSASPRRDVAKKTLKAHNNVGSRFLKGAPSTKVVPTFRR